MKKIHYIIQIVFPLSFGLFIYITCANGTYLNELFTWNIFEPNKVTAFFRFYFPDFLWCYSFCETLFLIYDPKKIKIFLCGLFSLLFGLSWEILQFHNIVNGTFDVMDCICYFTASTIAVTIELFLKGENKMKKTISILLTIIAVIAFSLFAIGSGSSEAKEQEKGKAEKTKTSDTEIGDYSLEVQGCRLAKDFEGKDIVIVKYLFANVSGEKAQSFSFAFDDHVFQNGVGLNECYIAADSAKYVPENQTKEIQKGASLEVEVAYELNDTTSDISVEVEELFSFNDQKITRTFSIK